MSQKFPESCGLSANQTLLCNYTLSCAHAGFIPTVHHQLLRISFQPVHAEASAPLWKELEIKVPWEMYVEGASVLEQQEAEILNRNTIFIDKSTDTTMQPRL